MWCNTSTKDGIVTGVFCVLLLEAYMQKKCDKFENEIWLSYIVHYYIYI